jgi:hypothetical protein
MWHVLLLKPKNIAMLNMIKLTVHKKIIAETAFSLQTKTHSLDLIRIILVHHTSYNVDDLKAPSSAINK